MSPEQPGAPLHEQARDLVARGRTGALATLSTRHPGHPFASFMPYAVDARGHPLLLVSDLSVHTRNLVADPRATLLVAEPAPPGDPLDAGRVTLVGTARRLAAAETPAARAAYLARHSAASGWVDFGDFGFWCLEVSDVYMVVGFGAMGWVTADAYASAGGVAPPPGS